MKLSLKIFVREKEIFRVQEVLALSYINEFACSHAR